MRPIFLTVSPDSAVGIIHPDSPPGSPNYKAVHNNNRLIWELSERGGADLIVSAPGHKTVNTRCVLPLGGSEELPWGQPGFEKAIPLDLEPDIVIPSIQRKHKSGVHFYNQDGSRYLWAGSTDFLFYKLWFQDIIKAHDVSQQRFDSGARLLRVLGMVPYQPVFDPKDFPDYYNKLPEFAAWLMERKFDLEFTIFAGRQSFTINEQTHFTNCVNQLRPSDNVFLELANEYWNNGIDPHNFVNPGGILASAGSSTSDSAPDVFWDFFGWHGRRDWPKLANLDDMYGVCRDKNVVGIHDEPIGFAEFDEAGRRTTSVLAAQSVASESARLGDGGTCHTQEGLYSNLWGPLTVNCANAFFKALKT